MSINLSPNDSAPHIQTVNLVGAPTVIPSSTGKYTVAVFLRHAGCPWCHLTIQILEKYKASFDQNSCKIVCFVQSDEKTIEKSIADNPSSNPSFSIIADPEMVCYKKYGIHLKKPGLHTIAAMPAWLKSVFVHKNTPSKSKDSHLSLVPGAFIIDNESESIVYANYDAQLYDAASIELLLGAISQ